MSLSVVESIESDKFTLEKVGVYLDSKSQNSAIRELLAEGHDRDDIYIIKAKAADHGIYVKTAEDIAIAAPRRREYFPENYVDTNRFNAYVMPAPTKKHREKRAYSEYYVSPDTFNAHLNPSTLFKQIRNAWKQVAANRTYLDENKVHAHGTAINLHFLRNFFPKHKKAAVLVCDDGTCHEIKTLDSMLCDYASDILEPGESMVLVRAA